MPGGTGPPIGRGSGRAMRGTAGEARHAGSDGHATVRVQPALADWTASCRATGLVGGSPDPTRTLLAEALTVLAEIPDRAEPPPIFAARVLKGDSHALDDGTRLSTLVLRAPGDPPRHRPGVLGVSRALCPRAGIADDDLPTTVLVGGPGRVHPRLRSCTRRPHRGEPQHPGSVLSLLRPGLPAARVHIRPTQQRPPPLLADHGAVAPPSAVARTPHDLRGPCTMSVRCGPAVRGRASQGAESPRWGCPRSGEISSRASRSASTAVETLSDIELGAVGRNAGRTPPCGPAPIRRNPRLRPLIHGSGRLPGRPRGPSRRAAWSTRSRSVC